MPSMTEKRPQNPSPENTPDTDEQSWDQLFDNIRVLALRRSEELLSEKDDSDVFDRGARSLRTLMSSAEVAQRMIRGEEKETETDEGSQDPVISDEDIRRVKRKLERQISRIEKEDRVDSQRADARSGAVDGVSEA